MAFGLFNFNPQPSAPANLQRGFPSPGAPQTGTSYNMGYPVNLPVADGGATTGKIPIAPVRPTKGKRTWYDIFTRRGFPAPEGGLQRRPPGTWSDDVSGFGGAWYVHSRPFSRGGPGYVPNFGKVLYNPIGAGIVALQRPHASYGSSGQYQAGAIWWVSQAIPTSIGLQGLTDPRTLAALLGNVNVQAVIPTTG